MGGEERREDDTQDETVFHESREQVKKRRMCEGR